MSKCINAMCRAYLRGSHAARIQADERTSMRALGAPGGGRRSTDAHCAARLCSSSSGAPSASVPRQPLSGAAPVARHAFSLLGGLLYAPVLPGEKRASARRAHPCPCSWCSNACDYLLMVEYRASLETSRHAGIMEAQSALHPNTFLTSEAVTIAIHFITEL